MKKTIAALMSLTVACAMFTPAFAAETESPTLISEPPAVISETPEETTGRYTFEVNGEDVSMDAVIMVPLRVIAGHLGFKVTWDNGQVLVDNDTMHCVVTIGADSYIVTTSVDGMDGMSAPFSLGAAPYVVDGTTYVPLELFDALLGSKAGTITLDDNKIKIDTEGPGNVELPDPFVECGTLAEAGAISGFELRAPESVGDHDRVFISAIDGELIDVLYESGEDTVRVRKGAGSEDISGDYGSYAETAVSEVDGMEVTMKGNAGKVNLAVWTSGEYTYSVSASAGMSPGEMADLIREIA